MASPNRSELLTTSYETRPLWRLTLPAGRKVSLDDLEGRTEVVAHYAIDELGTTGRPRIQPPGEIGSDKLEVHEGDILVSRLNPRRGHVFRVEHYDIPAVASSEFAVVRPTSDCDSRFVNYVLQTEIVRQHLDSHVRSVTKSHGRVEFQYIWNMTVPLPPIETQRRIADYLDVETGRIDQLVTLNQEAQDLSDERFLSEVVYHIAPGSRTVDLDVYGTDYWIGSVADGWVVEPLGTRYRVELGKMLNDERSRLGDQRPYIGNSNVRWDGFDLTDLKTMDFSDAEWHRYGLEPGDVLVCEGGEVGRAAVWSVDQPSGIHYQKALHRLRPRRLDLEEPRFIMYAIMAAARTGVFEAGSNRATIDHLTGEKLAEHRFPFPPVDDQRRIVADLDAASTRAEAARKAMRRQHELLQERRRAVIEAAVTGELEV